MTSLSQSHVSDVSFEELHDYTYVRPRRMRFTLEYLGRVKRRTWDVIEAHSAVAVLLYHTQKKGFVLVRQFRPAVYKHRVEEEAETARQRAGNAPAAAAAATAAAPVAVEEGVGCTYELCAGLVDKPDISLVETVREEVMEECGYNVPVDAITRICQSRGAVGLSGNLITLYYAEIDESMRISDGGGNPEEGEMLELVFLHEDDAEAFVFDDNFDKPASIAFAFYWYFSFYRAKRLEVLKPLDPNRLEPHQ